MNQDNTAETPLQAPPLSKTDVLRPLSILGGGGVVIVILCAICFCSAEDMYNAGWLVGYYGSIALWLGGAVVFIGVAAATSPLTVGRVAVKIQGMLPNTEPRQQELPAGLSIAPDLLIRFEAPTETPAMFAAKGFAFLHTKEQKDWALAVAWKERKAMILRSDGTVFEYFRNTPPWKKPEDWTDFHNYEHETWPEYDAAIEQDKRGWLAWVVGAKTEHAQGIQKGATFFEAFARATTVLAFLLCAAQAFAQPKSAQIAAYVGAHNFQNARVTGAVVFEFAKLPITRTANAQTLAQILTDARSYNDEDNAGKLKIITLNGKPIPRFAPEVAELPDLEKSTRADIAKFVRSSTKYANQADSTKIPIATGFENLTADSSTIADNMNVATQKVERWKRAGWAAAEPVWRFFMYVFGSFFGILLCLGGLCWYVADSATDETYIGYHGQTYTGKLARSAHESAAGWLLLICWTCFIVLLINVFLWLVYAGLDMWLVVLLWFGALGISSRITKKIVPNIKRLSKETGVQRA